MPFHCLVYTGRYIGPTRALIKWRWTLATMIMLYSINLLHQLFEENDLVSFERSVQKLCLFLHIYFAIIILLLPISYGISCSNMYCRFTGLF